MHKSEFCLHKWAYRQTEGLQSPAGPEGMLLTYQTWLSLLTIAKPDRLARPEITRLTCSWL